MRSPLWQNESIFEVSRIIVLIGVCVESFICIFFPVCYIANIIHLPIVFQIVAGIDTILSVLFFIHLFVPLYLEQYIRVLSEERIRSMIVFLKGMIAIVLFSMRTAIVGMLLLSALCQLILSFIEWNRKRGSILRRDVDLDVEESSEIRIELRRLISRTSSSIERYL